MAIVCYFAFEAAFQSAAMAQSIVAEELGVEGDSAFSARSYLVALEFARELHDEIADDLEDSGGEISESNVLRLMLIAVVHGQEKSSNLRQRLRANAKFLNGEV